MVEVCGRGIFPGTGMSVDPTIAVTYVFASMFTFAVRVHNSATSLSSNYVTCRAIGRSSDYALIIIILVFI